MVALAGSVAGLGLAAGLTRVLAGMLYGAPPSEMTTLVGVVGAVFAVASVASLRAARLEFTEILQDG
jgi:hypothetical protein